MSDSIKKMRAGSVPHQMANKALEEVREALSHPATDAKAMQRARKAFQWLDAELKFGRYPLPIDWFSGFIKRSDQEDGEA